MYKYFVSFMTLGILSSPSWSSELTDFIQSKIQNLAPDNCASSMQDLSSRLDALKVEDYLKELNQNSHSRFLDELFSMKISVHEKMRSFHKFNGLKSDCANAVRGSLRGLRTIEDYASEQLYRLNPTDGYEITAFEDGNPHVRRHPEVPSFSMKNDLKSGDIILSRGKAYTSGAIASLGEFDTQFSHLSVVYKDEKGKIWTVEAHIEVGSFVRSLEEHISDKNHRSMVFRFDDEVMARKAAQYIFQKVKKASDSTGNILYDFGFNLDENSQLFCSEIASLAYDVASEGKVKVPMFRSQILDRKPQFVRTLGINVASSFIPADIEVDPRFKIMAEFRNGTLINDNLQKDAIIHSVNKWNDELGYQLIQGSSGKSKLYRNVAWPLRRVPYLKKYFKDKMPINMGRDLIGYFGVLESIGALMQDHIKVLDNKSIEERGMPLTKAEKMEAFEAFRLADLELKKKGKLHKMYRPRIK